MLDETTGVSLGLIIAVGSVLVPVGGGFLALWFRIDNRFAEQSQARERAFMTEREAREKLDDKIDEVRDRLNREFVNHATLQKTEDRLIVAIEKLDASLEKVIAKVDAALVRFASRIDP